MNKEFSVEGRTDRLTEQKLGGQRQTDKQTEKDRDEQTDRQTTDRQTDRRTEKQTNREAADSQKQPKRRLTFPDVRLCLHYRN